MHNEFVRHRSANLRKDPRFAGTTLLAFSTTELNEAQARRADPLERLRKGKQAELAKARAQLENTKAAILEAIRTPSTKEMLDQAERRVSELEATLQTSVVKSKVAILPPLVESYLKDLEGPGSGTERQCSWQSWWDASPLRRDNV